VYAAPRFANVIVHLPPVIAMKPTLPCLLAALLAAPAFVQAPLERLDVETEPAAEKVLPLASPAARDPAPPAIESDVPLPPKVRPPDDYGPAVTIRTEGDLRIEEYREGGRLVMIRVVPKVGVPHSFLDLDGDGRLEGDPGSLDGGVKPVFYTLYEWE